MAKTNPKRPEPIPKTEWQKIASDDPELRRGMDRLHDLFQMAPTLGSLLDPRKEVGHDLFTASLDRLEEHLLTAIGKEEVQRNATATEIVVAASGMALAVELLLSRYTLIATNVPYLTRSKQSRELQEFCDRFFRDARHELATVFLRRCLELTAPYGSVAVVTPENWLFLSSYEDLRRFVLREAELVVLATLGPAAFRDMNWWAARTALTVLSAGQPRGGHSFAGLDASEPHHPFPKEGLLAEGLIRMFSQQTQGSKPEARITLSEGSDATQLAAVARALQGISTADSDRFVRAFWERAELADLATFQGSVRETAHFGGRSAVIDLESLQREASELGAAIRGRAAWQRTGVAVRQMRHLPATLHSGGPFDTNVSVILPTAEEDLPAIWCFCSDASFHEEVRKLDKKTNVTNATLAKVPFDLAHWKEVARERYPNGLPEPWSLDPVQWIFHGHAAHSTAALQVAVGRLVGYQWPAELDGQMRLSGEARKLAKKSQELRGFADRDGIVPLSSLRGEEAGAARLRALLAAAFGGEWSATKERELLAATPGTAASLDEWLRDDFFEEHCTLFYQRPFVWHLWDGRRDGFHALVNYHRLTEGGGKGRRLLESLAFAYLGEWIDRQRRAAEAGETGAEPRLAAALGLQKQIEKILKGEGRLPRSNEPGYDIFVRWKPLHAQAIGWEPDIADGVRLNSRPFLVAQLEGGRTGAGLFRAKPSIHWKKDRGAEPKRERNDFPWFYDAQGNFHGERHNDIHLTLEEKSRARETKKNPVRKK